MTIKAFQDLFNMRKFGGNLYNYLNPSKEIYDYGDGQFNRKTVITPKG